MSTIPLRDLHNHTSEILRQIRDDKAEYVVTQQGRPIARLSPVVAGPTSVLKSNGWQSYHRAAEEIRQSWPAGRSSQAVLADVRRRILEE